MSRQTAEAYFENMNRALKQQQRAVPSLLLNLDALDENISTFNSELNPRLNFRIVVKSLPSPQLIQHLQTKTNCHSFMLFHQPFLSDIIKYLNEKDDILLGKPMPIKTAEYFYQNLPEGNLTFDPYQQIQWLVDTQDRILQYVQLAKSLGQKIRLNLEIDVGLRRGGFQDLSALQHALELLQTHADYVTFSGFMGYDPHVVKIPKIIRSAQKSQRLSNHFYNECKALVKTTFPALWNEQLTFNGAGSPTLGLHNNEASPLNDVSAGSCFVKPTTFDIPELSAYKSACFIATPVLKKLKRTAIPGIEWLKKIMPFFNSRYAQSFFIYGGYWKADYVYPTGIQHNELYGLSTNQTMINANATVPLNVDDFVFLRPHQSEFVFLQFGKIITTRGGKILDHWNLLNNN